MQVLALADAGSKNPGQRAEASNGELLLHALLVQAAIARQLADNAGPTQRGRKRAADGAALAQRRR